MTSGLLKTSAVVLIAAALNGCASAPTDPVAQAPVVVAPATPPAAPPTVEPEPAPEMPPAGLPSESPTPADDGVLTGREVYRSFRDGLASPQCDDARGSRWRKHFSHAPAKLATDKDVLPLFAHVVQALRDERLPTEFALIPFIESGYNPRARSRNGPAGMWQFIAVTARNQGLRVGKGHDGRYSPVDSTRAATRYLKEMYDEFGGDWRLAMMAYNAGEFRIKGAMRRSGLSLEEAKDRPSSLAGLSPITHAYVQKLHALACLFEDAGEDEAWLARLDRPVSPLQATAAARTEPAEAETVALAGTAQPERALPAKARKARTHKVKNGESLWSIARRYGLSVSALLSINRLDAGSVLRPGMVLQLGGDAIR